MALELECSSSSEVKYFINDPIGVHDVDYFLPYDKIKKMSYLAKSKFPIAYLTHYEEDSPKKKERWQYAQLAKLKIGMNHQVNADEVILPGVDFARPITFGVCGRVYDSGRKNAHFVTALLAEDINVIAWGDPKWGAPLVESREAFYNAIDYLIITSSNEGAPIPLLEAMACGVPVIAPDVGCCFEFPVIQYEKNNLLDLLGVVSMLSKPRTWQDWAEDHYNLFMGIGLTK